MGEFCFVSFLKRIFLFIVPVYHYIFSVVQDKVDKVDYLVTFQRGHALQNLKGHGNNIKAVSPTWIQSVNCTQKFIPATNFLIE